MKNTGTVVGVILIVVLLVLLLGGVGMMSFGGFGMMGPGMMGGYGPQGFGFGFNPIGMILSLVSWVLVIGGGVFLVVWLTRSAGSTPRTTSSNSALEILKERYAKGEITKEQFDAIKRDLEA